MNGLLFVHVASWVIKMEFLICKENFMSELTVNLELNNAVGLYAIN